MNDLVDLFNNVVHTKRGKIYIFIAIITAILYLIFRYSALNPCNSLKKTTDEAEKDYLRKSGVINYNTDTGYKIFYGEWEATQKIGENYRFGGKDISDIIGTKLFFDGWNCNYYFNGEEVNINYPEYKITIIPLNENTTYIPYMPTLNEMGIKGNYVTIFTIVGGEDTYFFIKDDETLIMFYKDTYVELKRKNYTPGHETFYRAI